MVFATLSDIWSAAIERLSRLRELFGAPFAFLSLREELDARARRAVLAHLVPLERLVRCALIILALRETAPPPLRADARAPRPPSRSALHWPGADSSAWRGVRFRLLPRQARKRPRGPRSASTVSYRFPLAKRMEAIARVLAHPERWVRRLAAMFRTRRPHAIAVAHRLAAGRPNAPEDLAAARRLARAALADTS